MRGKKVGRFGLGAEIQRYFVLRFEAKRRSGRVEPAYHRVLIPMCSRVR